MPPRNAGRFRRRSGSARDAGSGARTPRRMPNTTAGSSRPALSRFRLVFGLTAHHTSCGVADIGAVEAQADASPHLGEVLLREIGVRARRAAASAGEALGDAAGERTGAGRAAAEPGRRSTGSGRRSSRMPGRCARPRALGARALRVLAARRSRTPGGRFYGGYRFADESGLANSRSSRCRRSAGPPGSALPSISPPATCPAGP
jgi:hypothetical protein